MKKVKDAEMVARGKHFYEVMQKARRKQTVLIDDKGNRHEFDSRNLAVEFLVVQTGKSFYHCKKMLYVNGGYGGYTVEK